MTEAWTVVFDGWNPADEDRRETLCTVGLLKVGSLLPDPGATPT
jgi:hypothetical protein